MNTNKRHSVRKNKLLYVLPKVDYFNEGDRGRVTHALGVSEGFSENDWAVEMLSGNGLTLYNEFVSKTTKLQELTASNMFDKLCWPIQLIKKFRRIVIRGNCNLFIVRYAVSKYIFCWLFALIAKNRNLKSVIEVNSFAYHKFKTKGILRKTLESIEIKLASQFDIVYAVSKSLADDLKSKGCKSLVIAIPNGASSNTIKVNDELNENSKSKFRFIYLGSLHSYYDYKIIVSAFKRIIKDGYDCELHFYGDGKKGTEIRNLSGDLSCIIFHGRYKKKEIGSILNRKTDILVLPPKVQSDIKLSGGLSTKLFEYMSLNIPIIAPGIGEINDVLIDGDNAILYQFDNTESLVESCRLILNRPDIADKIATNAFLAFNKKHTWRVRMKRLIKAVDGIS